eukprot:scaffold94358_cov65-Phaeocystis_antarctica.AAC.4
MCSLTSLDTSSRMRLSSVDCSAYISCSRSVSSRTCSRSAAASAPPGDGTHSPEERGGAARAARRVRRARRAALGPRRRDVLDLLRDGGELERVHRTDGVGRGRVDCGEHDGLAAAAEVVTEEHRDARVAERRHALRRLRVRLVPAQVAQAVAEHHQILVNRGGLVEPRALGLPLLLTLCARKVHHAEPRRRRWARHAGLRAEQLDAEHGVRTARVVVDAVARRLARLPSELECGLGGLDVGQLHLAQPLHEDLALARVLLEPQHRALLLAVHAALLVRCEQVVRIAAVHFEERGAHLVGTRRVEACPRREQRRSAPLRKGRHRLGMLCQPAEELFEGARQHATLFIRAALDCVRLACVGDAVGESERVTPCQQATDLRPHRRLKDFLLRCDGVEHVIEGETLLDAL